MGKVPHPCADSDPRAKTTTVQAYSTRKEKIIVKAGVEPLLIFMAAEDFSLAADALAHARINLKQQTRLVVAESTNAAFCVELYLKCLLSIHSPTVPVKHDLFFLYGQLPKTVREQLRKRFEGHPLHAAAAEKAREAGYDTRQLLLENHLKEVCAAFDKWRYRFEFHPEDVRINNLGLLRIVLREMLLKQNPTWEKEAESRFLSTLPSGKILALYTVTHRKQSDSE